ncbi:MAG TPA: ribosome biogenesis factor YjgA [Gammaproteobacteria bacterium]|nr:ribosome biogenesis factor YjgA [Gammaproteobacteria bacterium]
MHEDDNERYDEPPSKSQRRRDMEALQALGEELVGLPATALRNIPMPDTLREAVMQARTITAHGGRRRQLQYIGKLMREVDATPIRAALEQRNRQSRESAQHFHQLEQLRDRLLQDGDSVVDEVCERHPTAERQRLRQWLLQARREKERGQPPKAARQLFRYLRELEEGEASL